MPLPSEKDENSPLVIRPIKLLLLWVMWGAQNPQRAQGMVEAELNPPLLGRGCKRFKSGKKKVGLGSKEKPADGRRPSTYSRLWPPGLNLKICIDSNSQTRDKKAHSLVNLEKGRTASGWMWSRDVLIVLLSLLEASAFFVVPTVLVLAS